MTLLKQQAYYTSLRQLRGMMQKVALKKIKAQKEHLINTKANNLAQYQIRGFASLKQEAGLALLEVVHDNKLINEQVVKVFLAQVDYIHTLLQQEGRTNINIGMSGGADSTLCLALAAALKLKYNYIIKAIHCIHGLDPDDEIWLEHNKSLCQNLLPTLSAKLKLQNNDHKIELITPILHIQYQSGVSKEDASRQERYRALLEINNKEQDALMLGHQADDQIEGFILALKRGAGLTGLGGMRIITQDQRGLLIRPLLHMHKVEIEQMLSSLNIDYVYDLSNSYVKFERNFVRLEVLPLLRTRFKGIDKAILRSQKLCTIEKDLAERYIQDKIEQYIYFDPYYKQYIFKTHKLDLSDQSLVFMLLREFIYQAVGQRLDFNLIEQCYNLLISPQDANGKVKLLDHIASSYRGDLYIFKPMAQFTHTSAYTLELNTPLIINNISYSIQEATDNTQVYFYSKSNNFTLSFKVKHSQELHPIYRQHKRSLKKLMLENNITPWHRDLIPLIFDNSTEPLAYGNVFALRHDNNLRHIGKKLCLNIKW